MFGLKYLSLKYIDGLFGHTSCQHEKFAKFICGFISRAKVTALPLIGHILTALKKLQLTDYNTSTEVPLLFRNDCLNVLTICKI